MERVICVSEIFFFVCFVVVLVGGGSNYTATLWKSKSEVGKDTVDALLILYIIVEGLAEDAPHNHQHSLIEVKVCIDTLVWAHEGCFQGKTVY